MIDEVPYPFVQVIVLIGTWEHVGTAYLDTGVDGGLMIPAAVGKELLAEPERTLLKLPDNALVRVDSWTGDVEIHNRRFRVDVSALGSRYLMDERFSIELRSVSSLDRVFDSDLGTNFLECKR